MASQSHKALTGSPHKYSKRTPDMILVANKDTKYESFVYGSRRKIGVDPITCGGLVVALVSPRGALVTHISPPKEQETWKIERDTWEILDLFNIIRQTLRGELENSQSYIVYPTFCEYIQPEALAQIEFIRRMIAMWGIRAPTETRYELSEEMTADVTIDGTGDKPLVTVTGLVDQLHRKRSTIIPRSPRINVGEWDVKFESFTHGTSRTVGVDSIRPGEFVVAVTKNEGAVVAHFHIEPTNSEVAHLLGSLHREVIRNLRHYQDATVTIIYPDWNRHRAVNNQPITNMQLITPRPILMNGQSIDAGRPVPIRPPAGNNQPLSTGRGLDDRSGMWIGKYLIEKTPAERFETQGYDASRGTTACLVHPRGEDGLEVTLFNRIT